jgi:hypothetical protein
MEDPVMFGAVVRRAAAPAALAALLLAVPAAAQTASTYTDLPQGFRLDIGGFRIASETRLKYDLSGDGGTIDFENETALPDNATTLWLDGTFRVGRRHQLSLNYTKSNREGGRTLEREIHWGDQVFQAGAQVESELATDILTGYYRFAVFKNDRFEIGPTLGVGYLWLSAGLRVTATAGGATGSRGQTGKTGSVTGDVGGYFEGWLGKRIVARGDLLYIIVKPGESEASVTDGRLGLYFHPWSHVGFGAQYKYYKYRYDRAGVAAEVGGSIRFRGGQVFASFLF